MIVQGIIKRFFVSAIRLYKRFVSPMLPPACRFIPTCSEYALEAFERKDLFTAVRITVVRVCKCHPFHPGGYDPVQ